MLKDSNLKEDHDLTLKAAVKHYLEHLHKAETSNGSRGLQSIAEGEN